MCMKTEEIEVLTNYFRKIVRNTNLTNGPTKNTCRQSATGKHCAANCIHCVNQSAVNPL